MAGTAMFTGRRGVTAALDHRSYLDSRRMPALDGVRALAVLMVITWHVRSGVFAALNGDFGVTVFFILSGFLVTTLAVREQARFGHFSYAAFLVRRAFRILPLLWLGIAAYAVLVIGLHLDPRAAAYEHAIPFYLFYLPEYPSFSHAITPGHGEGPVPFSGVWSLGIEEKFYLVWPLVALVVLAKARRARLALAAAIAVGLWVFHLYGPVQPVRFLSNYAPIALGAFCALLLETERGHRLAVRLTHPLLAVPVLVVAVVANAFRPGPVGVAGQQLLVALLLVAVVLRPRSIGARALSHRLLRRIGVLSYALYLFHSLALKVVDRVLPAGGGVLLGLASLGGGLVLAVGVCEVLHRFYEKPLQDVGRRLSARINHHREPRLGEVLSELRA